MEHVYPKASENIFSFGYDPESQTLETRFFCKACDGTGKTIDRQHACGKCAGTGHSGTYSYSGVSPEIHAQLMAAHKGGQSVGTLHHALVKKGGFKFEFRPHGGKA